MIFIFGTRPMGRVDEHGEEWAATRFFHIWFLPIVPRSTHWIIANGAGPKLQHPMKTSGRSILAAYLRAWGLVMCVGLLPFASEGHPLAYLASAGCALISIAAWRNRLLRGARAKRRSDFNLIAFGTRCEPARWQTARVKETKQRLDMEWARIATDRSPDEVARLGGATPYQSVIAYGVLRLASLGDNAGGNAAHVAAESILDDAAVPSDLDATPYRAPARAPAVTANPADLAALVETVALRAPVPVPAAPMVTVGTGSFSRKQMFVVLAVGALIAGAGIYNFVSSLGADLVLTSETIDKAAIGRITTIDCDDIATGWVEEGRPGREPRTLALCVVGGHYVPVVFTGLRETLPHHVSGTLRDLDDLGRQASSEILSTPDIGPAITHYYLDSDGTSPHDRSESIAAGILVIAGVIATILWFRRHNRRRRLAIAQPR